MPRFLKPQEVAAMLAVSVRTLECWRASGDGPEFSKPTPRTVRYREDVVEDFMERGTRRSTSDPGDGARA